MNNGLKILLYVICTALAAYFGVGFMKAFSARMDASSQRFDSLTGSTEAGSAVEDPATNAVAEPLPARTTNGLAGATTNPVPTAAGSATNVAALRATTNPPPSGLPKAGVSAPPTADHSKRLGLYAALALAGVLGLAILVARDISQYAAQRTHEFMYNDEGKGISDPLYDKAEQTWADGDHLEAIRLLREFLARNPRELHARLRVAEIYEKDLNNPLAAALEYEDILQTRFDPDRWGWSAIHLCNLYARLNQPAKMNAWMERVANEVPQTAAARKAREKLGWPEDYAPGAIAEAASETDPGDGEMPRGFKRKKA